MKKSRGFTLWSVSESPSSFSSRFILNSTIWKWNVSGSSYWRVRTKLREEKTWWNLKIGVLRSMDNRPVAVEVCSQCPWNVYLWVLMDNLANEHIEPNVQFKSFAIHVMIGMMGCSSIKRSNMLIVGWMFVFWTRSPILSIYLKDTSPKCNKLYH